jgi:NDP-sugar pyrophosphorylase family protein
VLNILIPMAGRGERFREAGFKLPKPLIDVQGRPMIKVVIDNLRPKVDHRFIFLCLREHVQQMGLDSKLDEWAPGREIVLVDQVTQGAACTVLLAKKLIDNSDPLMIANCDQYVDIDMDDYLSTQDEKNADGLIMTFLADSAKWSYCGMRPDGTVSSVVEKKVISKEATVGIYNYRKGADFVKAAEEMIRKNLRVNGEFYVAPVYNEMISQGARIVTRNIGSDGRGMYGLGTPADYDYFMKNKKL